MPEVGSAERSGGPPLPPGTPANADAWAAPRGIPWPPLVLIAVVVVLSGAVIGWQLLRPTPSSPRVLTDVAFVTAANQACTDMFPALRPQATSRDDQVSPAEIADQATKAADGLDSLAARLRSIEIAPDQQVHVSGWLDEWKVFTTAGRQYADAVRTGDVQRANAIARTGDPAQRKADAFARGNKLGSCLLQQAFVAPQGQGGVL